MVGVEQRAEVRRQHFVRGLSIHEIHRRTGLHRDTIRRALRSDGPPRYVRAPKGSKLDPFKNEIHRLLAEDPTLTGVGIRERLEPVGFDGQKTIVDDYLREIRPIVNPPRTFQAHRLPPRRNLPVRPLGAAGRNPGRARYAAGV